MSKERYYSDPEYREHYLSYHRNWAKNNNYWWKENRPHRNLKEEWLKQKIAEGKQREELKKIFGSKCILCPKEEGKMYLHEIHGKSHSSRHPSFYLLRQNNFRKLCGRCHNMVHGLLRFGITWEQTIDFLGVEE